MLSLEPIILQIALLVILPMLAIQVRFLIYKRTQSETKRSLVEGLLEAIPHDLCIMGMTLGVTSFTSRVHLFVMIGAFIPLYFAAFIPIIEKPRMRLVLGLIAYLFGASGYFFSHYGPFFLY